MLGKLIKNDLISGLHTVSAVYLSALIAAVVIIFGMTSADRASLKAVLAIALLAVMAFIVVFTFFAVIAMFSKSVYGNPGYLTLTLPAKSWQLLFSKTLTGIIFTLVSYIALIGSIVWTIDYLSAEKEASLVEMLWGQLEAGGVASLSTIGHSFVLMAILGLISVFLIVASLHMSVTLTNISKLDKLGTFGSVIFFFVLYGVLSSFAKKLGDLVGLRIIVSGQSYFMTFSDAVVQAQDKAGAQIFSLSTQFFMLLFAFALCAGTAVLVRKSVNIK